MCSSILKGKVNKYIHEGMTQRATVTHLAINWYAILANLSASQLACQIASRPADQDALVDSEPARLPVGKSTS